MSVCNFFGWNEDISENILNIIHYVELIYTYHISLFAKHVMCMLPCMLHACYMSVENDCNIRLTCMLPCACYCLLDACYMHVTCALFRIGRVKIKIWEGWIKIWEVRIKIWEGWIKIREG